MTVKNLNYESKFIKDSIKQLNNNETVYAISDKMKRDLENEVDLIGLRVTRETHEGYWSYTKEIER